MTDYDGDGRKDESEDVDDDNDGVEDSLDECPTGVMNPDRVDRLMVVTIFWKILISTVTRF